MGVIISGFSNIGKSYISKNSEYANKILDISDKIISYDLLKDLK